MTLAKASGAKVLPKRDAGGDNEVERDGNGSPRILIDCPKCEATGGVPSEKVEGRINQCPTCKGDKRVKRSFTRVTTFIDALEDKEQLIVWKSRMTLIGAAKDPSFLQGVLDYDRDSTEGKDALNRRAEAAADFAGASDKADHGTMLHGYSELADEDLDLPLDMDMQDWVDMQAYLLATKPLLNIVHMEQLVVCDEFKTAGTPDRISSVREEGLLVAPDGHVFTADELIITDLKTGRVDLGQLKMSMQLSIYANSKLYGKDDGARIELGNINRNWGIIMHLAAGSGVCELYWADLQLGWEGVHLAAKVREIRSRGRKGLSLLELPAAS